MVSSRDDGLPPPLPVLLSIVSLTYRCNALLIRFHIDPAKTATLALVCSNAHCMVSTEVVVTLSQRRVGTVSSCVVVVGRPNANEASLVNDNDEDDDEGE